MRPITLKSSFLIILIFFFTGCDNKDIVSPVTAPATVSEPDWISLPANEDNSLKKTFTSSKLVQADRQEFITLSSRYRGGEFGSVSIDCVIVFPIGALKEDTEITMTLDDKNGYVTFEPQMQFGVPVKFTMILKGLDSEKINETGTDFIYFDESKGIEQIDYKRLNIDPKTGTIGVHEAQLNHFSRYGFTT